MRLLLFVLVELVLCPVTLLGAIAFVGIILVLNRRRGISGTAYEPLLNRVLYHNTGMRRDAAAKRLSAELPASSPLVWALFASPTLLAVRLSGYVPKFLRFPVQRPPSMAGLMALRTEFFDTKMREALADVTQLVILGAGWDTRAYDLPTQWRGTVYEVDAPATQRAKRAALRAAGIDSRHVRFVALDFNESSWLDALEAVGLDRSQPVHIVWEGVTMYLSRGAISSSLDSLAAFAPGSSMALDYIAAELIDAEPPHRWIGRALPALVWLTYGEKFISGLPMQPEPRSAIAELLAAHNLVLDDFDAVAGLYGFALARVPLPRADA